MSCKTFRSRSSRESRIMYRLHPATCFIVVIVCAVLRLRSEVVRLSAIGERPLYSSVCLRTLCPVEVFPVETIQSAFEIWVSLCSTNWPVMTRHGLGKGVRSFNNQGALAGKERSPFWVGFITPLLDHYERGMLFDEPAMSISGLTAKAY